MDIDQAKQQVRRRIWDRLEQAGAVLPPGAQGRIPNFAGADAAAWRLTRHPAWRAAKVIKANPDKPQLPVRLCALQEGRLVYMAVPKLADLRPFYRLDPADPTPEQATSKTTTAPKVLVEEMLPVDLIVCGSVAVNREGVRLGKGAGYSDIEVALLIEAGLIGPHTTIVTTVHSLQVVDEPLPETEHDFRVDLIATPDELITCGRSRRPTGVLWDDLTPEKINAIPALAARTPER